MHIGKFPIFLIDLSLELFTLKMIHLLSSHSFLLHFTINQVLWGTLQQNLCVIKYIIPSIKLRQPIQVYLNKPELLVNFIGK